MRAIDHVNKAMKILTGDAVSSGQANGIVNKYDKGDLTSTEAMRQLKAIGLSEDDIRYLSMSGDNLVDDFHQGLRR